jgi:hypothetical protein
MCRHSQALVGDFEESSWNISNLFLPKQALDRDNREHSPEMGRQLAWDHEGQYIAQDVARGLYFLHNIDVRGFADVDA